MPFYGYARVSTTDQDLNIQKIALKAAGCSVVRAEKVSGTKRDGRLSWNTCLSSCRRVMRWSSHGSTGSLGL